VIRKEGEPVPNMKVMSKTQKQTEGEWNVVKQLDITNSTHISALNEAPAAAPA
jgi:hypothetical protein